MSVEKFRKKPVVLEAIRLTERTIKEVYKFIYGENSVDLSCRSAEDAWDNYEMSVKVMGLRLKTPESDGETQVASIGDYVFKGYTEELGWHFWPVKESYVREMYEPVIET
jgi:hypothetical protein